MVTNGANNEPRGGNRWHDREMPRWAWEAMTIKSNPFGSAVSMIAGPDARAQSGRFACDGSGLRPWFGSNIRIPFAALPAAHCGTGASPPSHDGSRARFRMDSATLEESSETSPSCPLAFIGDRETDRAPARSNKGRKHHDLY